MLQYDSNQYSSCKLRNVTPKVHSNQKNIRAAYRELPQCSFNVKSIGNPAGTKKSATVEEWSALLDLWFWRGLFSMANALRIPSWHFNSVLRNPHDIYGHYISWTQLKRKTFDRNTCTWRSATATVRHLQVLSRKQRTVHSCIQKDLLISSVLVYNLKQWSFNFLGILNS